MLRFLTSVRFFVLFTLWQAVVLFTPFSLYGLWTDVLVFAWWIVLIACMALDLIPARAWMQWISRIIGLGVVIVVLAAFSSLAGMFFIMELAGSRSVPQERKVQGMFFVNQYFIPTGAYGCGMGRLITAKAPVFFPLIEYRTEYDPCTHEDWGYLIDHGSWEGWDEGPAN